MALAPPIVPWDELKAGSDDELLWIGPNDRTLRERIADWFHRPRRDDPNKWRDMLPAFAAMEHVNKTPFFYVHAPISVFTEKAGRARKIGRGRGQYSRGFPVKPSETYRLRVDEITPNAFCDDAPTASPFTLTIEKSDSAIRPTVKDVQIDGPYGHYEFSFDV